MAGEKFVFNITDKCVIHNLQCHYVSLGKFDKLKVWIVPTSHYLKLTAITSLPSSTVYVTRFLRRFLIIFVNSMIEDFYTTSYNLENSV